MDPDVRYVSRTCGWGRLAQPWVSAQPAKITTKCQSKDSWNDFQGKLVGRKTSCQRSPGEEVLKLAETGSKAWNRLLKKTRCAGSRSTSRFRRGSALGATLVSELKSSKAFSMDPTRRGETLIHYRPMTPPAGQS